MKELQQKQRIKRRLYSIPALIILLIATVFVVRGAYEVVEKERESAQHVSDLEDKMKTLTKREAKLKEEIVLLGTSDGVDMLIKDKFNVSKEGERVAVIVDRVNKSTSTPTTESNWLNKLWQSFLDLW